MEREIPDKSVKQRFVAAGKKARQAGLSGSPNSISFSQKMDLSKVRDNSNHLAINNPWSKRAIDTDNFNLIGTGLIPVLRFEDRDNEEYKKSLQEFKDWADDPDSCDFYGKETLHGLASLAAKDTFRNGNFLLGFRTESSDDDISDVPLKLRLLDPRRVDVGYSEFSNRKTKKSGKKNRISMGIEFDSEGREVAYHLLKSLDNRGEGRFRVKKGEYIFECIPDFSEQNHGHPAQTPVMVKSHNLEQYQDCQLTKQRAQASETHILKKPYNPDFDSSENDMRKKIHEANPQTTDDNASEAIANDEEIDSIEKAYDLGYQTCREDLNQQFEELREQASQLQGGDTLEPGVINEIPEGYELEISKTAHVNDEAYIRSILRAISANSGQMYQSITGDYSQSSYSVLRHGRIDVNTYMKQKLFLFLIPKFYQKIWKKWASFARIKGYKCPKKIEFVPPAPEPLHPGEWSNYLITMARAGVFSFEDLCHAAGKDPETQIKRKKYWNERLIREGIKTDTDPAWRDKTGKPVTDTEED